MNSIPRLDIRAQPALESTILVRAWEEVQATTLSSCRVYSAGAITILQQLLSDGCRAKCRPPEFQESTATLCLPTTICRIRFSWPASLLHGGLLRGELQTGLRSVPTSR